MNESWLLRVRTRPVCEGPYLLAVLSQLRTAQPALEITGEGVNLDPELKLATETLILLSSGEGCFPGGTAGGFHRPTSKQEGRKRICGNQNAHSVGSSR